MYYLVQRAWYFFIAAGSCGISLEIAGTVPVIVNSVHNTNKLNAGKFGGNGSLSLVNAGIYLHSSGPGNEF